MIIFTIAFFSSIALRLLLAIPPWHKPPCTTQTYIPIVSPAEIERREKQRMREAEKARKAKQEREQAASDYDRLSSQRETVLALCEAIERELNTCTSDTRRTQLLSKLVTNENRLASIDRRRDKAFCAAFAA